MKPKCSRDDGNTIRHVDATSSDAIQVGGSGTRQPPFAFRPFLITMANWASATLVVPPAKVGAGQLYPRAGARAALQSLSF